VPHEHIHLVVDLVIDAVHKVIFVGNLERRSNEKCRSVSQVRRVWSLVEIKKGLDCWVHGYDTGRVATATVEEARVCPLESSKRNDSKLGLRGRHFGPYRKSIALPQPFVGPEEESSIFLDGPSQSGTKLVASIRRHRACSAMIDLIK